MQVIFEDNSFLKALPAEAKVLENQEELDPLISIKRGTKLEILHQEPYVCPSGEHLLIQLKRPPRRHKDSRWFVFAKHVRVEGCEPKNNPAQHDVVSKPEVVTKEEPTIKVPGISAPVGLYSPIYEGSHFNWSEFTKRGARIPVDSTVTGKIVRLARYMDDVRAFLGDKPIKAAIPNSKLQTERTMMMSRVIPV
ncbi:MAG: hypothetical protein AAFQ92_27855 [Bacteroidota bacterium]